METVTVKDMVTVRTVTAITTTATTTATTAAITMAITVIIVQTVPTAMALGTGTGIIEESGTPETAGLMRPIKCPCSEALLDHSVTAPSFVPIGF